MFIKNKKIDNKEKDEKVQCNLNEHCVLGLNHNSPYCKIPIDETLKDIDIILKEGDKIFKKRLSKLRNLEIGDVIYLFINDKREPIELDNKGYTFEIKNEIKYQKIEIDTKELSNDYRIVSLKPGDLVKKKNKDRLYQIKTTMFRDLQEHKRKINLEYGDKVNRFLIDGDIVLLNRQPTLHKGSMLAKKIKFLIKKHLV